MAYKSVLKPLKKWGQHFLVDQYYLETIIRSGELKSEDNVLEIGPGDGQLTELLLASGAKINAVEIDKRMADHLRKKFSDKKNFQLFEKDFFKLSPSEIKTIFNGKQKTKIIANLPYYVTTPILTKLLTWKDYIEMLVIMVQKEVGERMTATVGTRKAGAITLYLHYYTTLEIISTVPAVAFLPQPKVDSAILKILPRTAPKVFVKSEEIFWIMIKTAFAQRRKTLVNALSAADEEILSRVRVEAGLESLGLGAKIRGEKMTLEEFAALCNYLIT